MLSRSFRLRRAAWASAFGGLGVLVASHAGASDPPPLAREIVQRVDLYGRFDGSGPRLDRGLGQHLDAQPRGRQYGAGRDAGDRTALQLLVARGAGRMPARGVLGPTPKESKG